MAPRVMHMAPGHEGNMSRVRIAQELEMQCLNTSTATSLVCDRSAQGINMSTPILMMTFGVVGNVLALIVLYSSRREAHARRTVFFVMLAGLAWTDLIGQFAVSPIAIITYANNLRWLGGAQLCRYHGFMMVSFGLVMPLIVCCMSVERLLAIKFSYYYAKHITRRKAQITFLASWCVTCLFTCLPFLGVGSYELQYPGTWCFLNFHRESKVDTIYAALFSSFNIIAILITILCNLIVAGALYRMRRSRQLHSSPSIDRRLSASGVGSNTSGTALRGRRHSDMEAQMIWFLCLITVAFSVCWLPLNVHILVMQFTGTTNQVLDLKFIRMASCNQILDPWLYVIFRKNSLIRIVRRLKVCLSVMRKMPKKEQTKAPTMRYVISNKSYTYEATNLGKSAMGGRCCLNSATLSRHYIQDVNKEAKRNDCSDGSSNSVAQLMSVCSYCDRHNITHSASNLINESASEFSSYTPEIKEFSTDLSAKTLQSGTDESIIRHRTAEMLCLGNTARGISEPLLVITNKSKKVHKKWLKTLDISSSDDSHGAYYSLDSPHQPSIISGNYSKQKKISSTDVTKKSLFLGLSKSSPHSETLSGYSQSMTFLNSPGFLLLPSLSPEQLTSLTIEEQISLTDSEKGHHNSRTVSIPHVLDNIPESLYLTPNGHKAANLRNQSISASESFCSNLLPPSDTRISLFKSFTDSQFVYSNDDICLYNTAFSRVIDPMSRCVKSGHNKPRSCNGASRDFSEEEFHRLMTIKPLSCALKLKSRTFPRKLFSTSKTNQTNRNSVSIAGAQLGSCNSLLQNVDHSDHIKCFKAKRTPTFLGKNGANAYLEGLKYQTNSCGHGFLELSVGSCP